MSFLMTPQNAKVRNAVKFEVFSPIKYDTIYWSRLN